MQNTARMHISPYGWVMIILLLGLGVINFADKEESSWHLSGQMMNNW